MGWTSRSGVEKGVGEEESLRWGEGVVYGREYGQGAAAAATRLHWTEATGHAVGAASPHRILRPWAPVRAQDA